MKTTQSVANFVIIRHGETEWNKIGRQQGQLNSDLSDLGIKQAHAVADELKNYSFDLFYTSDLGRAIETAKIISESIDMPFITESRLRERHLGILQGLTKKDFIQRYPSEAENFICNDPEYIIPSGESALQRHTRCVACMEDLALKHLNKSILIVTHGGMLMSCFNHALNIPLNNKRKYSLFNGSINSFTIDNKLNWRLESWGDIHHMITSNLSTLDDS